jgi:lysophospholipase L1-like esterase
MAKRITRRHFLSLGLTTLASACAPQAPPPTPTATIAPTPTPDTDTTVRTYAPDDADIRYTGRIDFSDPAKPKYSAPGVTVQARFRGTAAAVMLADEFKWGTNRNYYDAVIDGATVVKIAPEAGETRYEVAGGLANSEHTLELVKRTEASIGYCRFLGFEFAGRILPAADAPTRRIEFIGDSIACGAGDEAEVNSKECSADGWGQPYNNVRLAFGPVLARSLGAACHVSAVSGIGLVRNYSFQYDPRPMPEVYDLMFFEQKASPAWDPARFVPDAVVIGLGTNDFSPGDGERPKMEVDAFVAAYLQFIRRLRGYYPDAVIFCISSPMLGDRWPDATYMSATDQKTAITRVVEEMNAGGDADVRKFFCTPIVGMGCGTHPNTDQHAVLAGQLGSEISAALGW